MAHRCWPRYIDGAVLLACGIVSTAGVVALGYLAGQSTHAYVPALTFCVDALGPFGPGCWR